MSGQKGDDLKLGKYKGLLNYAGWNNDCIHSAIQSVYEECKDKDDDNNQPNQPSTSTKNTKTSKKNKTAKQRKGKKPINPNDQRIAANRKKCTWGVEQGDLIQIGKVRNPTFILNLKTYVVYILY